MLIVIGAMSIVSGVVSMSIVSGVVSRCYVNCIRFYVYSIRCGIKVLRPPHLYQHSWLRLVVRLIRCGKVLVSQRLVARLSSQRGTAGAG